MQLEIPRRLAGAPRVHFGVPVEAGRGFVLHSADYVEPGSLVVGNEIRSRRRSTSCADRARRGAAAQLLGLGYAGWGPGQLDGELQQNGWLHAPPRGHRVRQGPRKNGSARWRSWRDLTTLSGDAARLSGQDRS